MDSLLKAEEEGNVRRKEEVPTDAVVQQLLEEIKVAKENRQKAIDGAMKILRALPKKDLSYQNELARAEAAKALGDLRAGDSSYAVELLVDDIYSSCRQTVKNKEGRPLLGMDAAQSLVKIGLPAAKKMIESLGKEKSDRELMIYARVFREMFGERSVAAWVRQEMDFLELPPPVLEPGIREKQMRHIYELVKDPNYLSRPQSPRSPKEKSQDAEELPKE